MHKEKLTEYQLKSVKSALARSYDRVEDELLVKYEVHAIEDLNASDYDDIIDDIIEWTGEITDDVL